MDPHASRLSLAIVGALVALPSAAVVVWLIRRKSKIPEHPLPPVGPSFNEVVAAFTSSSLLEMQVEWVNRYGKLFRSPSPLPGVIPDMVLCADTELMKHILSTLTNNYQPPYQFSRPKLFTSLVGSSIGRSVTSMVGEEWKWRRIALLKEFHRNRLLDDDRRLFEAILDAGNRLREAFDRAALTGEMVKLDVLATQASADIFFYLLIGKKVDFDVSLLRSAAYTVLGHILYVLSNPFRWLNPVKHLKMIHKKNAAKQSLDRFIRSEVEALISETKTACAAVDAAVARGASPEEVQKVYDDHLPPRDRKPHSIIESLLINEPRFRNDLTQVLDEARVLLLAGFDTTAHSLAFAFGLLADKRNATTADLLAREAEAALNGSSTITRAALDLSPNILNFYHETLRIFPLVPLVGGECVSDIVIDYKGQKLLLRKGTQVNFVVKAMQNDPELVGPRPECLDIQRWNTSVENQPFLATFSKGAHVCPGKPLSLLEAHILLLCTVKDYEFQLPEGVDRVECVENIVVRPKNDLPLYVRKRSKPQ